MITYFRETKENLREAWQNGKKVFRWSKAEIDKMHAESPHTVPAFGSYKHNAYVAAARSEE